MPGEITEPMYVVSSTLSEPEWSNSTLMASTPTRRRDYRSNTSRKVEVVRLKWVASSV